MILLGVLGCVSEDSGPQNPPTAASFCESWTGYLPAKKLEVSQDGVKNALSVVDVMIAEASAPSVEHAEFRTLAQKCYKDRIAELIPTLNDLCSRPQMVQDDEFELTVARHYEECAQFVVGWHLK
jgi:hypothetical protein